MQDKNDKVAFFDFCETLTDFQTADAYVRFVREKYGNDRMRRIEAFQLILKRSKILGILQRLYGKKGNVNKLITAFQLRGRKENELKRYAHEYYEELIKPHFIKDVLNILIEKKKQGYKVGLVSGGYGIYLEYFATEYNLDFVLSSNIEFRNGICTGKLLGPDCLNDNKLLYLKRLFIDPPLDSVAFSDSQSDIPLLQYASKGVVISRNKHQDWVDNYNFREIIWIENH